MRHDHPEGETKAQGIENRMVFPCFRGRCVGLIRHSVSGYSRSVVAFGPGELLSRAPARPLGGSGLPRDN